MRLTAWITNRRARRGGLRIVHGGDAYGMADHSSRLDAARHLASRRPAAPRSLPW